MCVKQIFLFQKPNKDDSESAWKKKHKEKSKMFDASR